ncbi:DUF6639 family protein [Psychromarinibacter halotolerans]|uniref:DUF6639 family protein n=1 Tax=Psychromarinibacter halotolerans TaxID=1775175 RepID=A0ABV7GR61_9RHOB|nr:DUF6639 family protein [Psychromarinibacter halotolerans]MDF0595005.1 hypothetical protein [Psychromarinibacter halotolerans]
MPNRRPIWLLTALPGLFGMLPVDAHALDCFADGRVSVTGGEPTLERHVCDVVGAALPVLAACNLPLSKPLTIDVVDDLPGGCVGMYHCGEDRIEILTPEDTAAVRNADTPFRDLDDAAFHDSVIVHELAHALHDQVPCPLDSCIISAEYVAYAMQIRSLTPDAIVAFEARGAVAGPVSREDLTLMMLFMAPHRFSATAWAHFSQRPDGCGYIGQIMSGAILLDSERP